jgi:hypothetical protein
MLQDNDLVGFDLEGSNKYNNQTSGFINSEISRPAKRLSAIQERLLHVKSAETANLTS